MKKQDKILLWPAYFDLKKTCREGRRVPKSLAVVLPKLEEIQKAAKSIGLQPEVIFDAKYPKNPWQKTGYLLIPKKGLKTQIIRKIAEELVHIRK